MIRKSVLTILIFVFYGCEGRGLFCPFNVPSCCFNALFGCGTFDLPVGCSCSQYGFLNRSGIQMSSLFRYSTTGKVKNKSRYQGTWSGILDRKSSNCSSSLQQINGIVFIREKNGSVSVTIPGYGTLKGKVIRNGIQASGSYSPKFSSCTAKVDVIYYSMGRGIGKASAKVNYSCGLEVSCLATYKGTLQKQ